MTKFLTHYLAMILCLDSFTVLGFEDVLPLYPK